MAVSSLVRTLADKDAPPSDKVRAAEVILNQAASAYQREVLESRVDELEDDNQRMVRSDDWDGPAESLWGFER